MANAAAIQADGKIILAATSQTGSAASNSQFALLRYNADGTPDTAFSASGIETSRIGSGDNATAPARSHAA